MYPKKISIISSLGVSVFPFSNMMQWYNYLVYGTGSLAANALGASGFIKTNIAKAKNETRPDIQLYGLPFGMSNGNGLLIQEPLNLNSTVNQQWVDFFHEHSEDRMEVMALSILMRPKSRGTVSLKSGDYNDHPYISGNFLSEREDLDRMIDICKFIPTLEKTKTFQSKDIKLMPQEKLVCGEHEVKKGFHFHQILRK